MADADVQITAGSGTKIDTRTVGAGTDEHRQVVCIGDPSTANRVALIDTNGAIYMVPGSGAQFDVVNSTPLQIGDATNGVVVTTLNTDNQSAAVNQLVIQSRGHVFNGTGWDRMRGDTTNGLDVDVTRIIPGVASNNLGKQEDQLHQDGDTGVLMLGVRNHLTGSTVDGEYSAISVSSTGEMQTLARRDLQRIAVGVTGVTTATTAYVAGDQVGLPITLANAARVSGGSGTIVGATLIDQSDIIGAYDLVIFDSSVTLATDNLAFAISDADSLKIVALIQLAGAFDLTNNRIAQSYNLAIPYVCSGGTSLFAALINRAGHTFFTTGQLPQVNVYVERN